jgi:hypothetical protein
VGVARIARLATAAAPDGTGQVRMTNSLCMRRWWFVGLEGDTPVAGDIMVALSCTATYVVPWHWCISY